MMTLTEFYKRNKHRQYNLTLIYKEEFNITTFKTYASDYESKILDVINLKLGSNYHSINDAYGCVDTGDCVFNVYSDSDLIQAANDYKDVNDLDMDFNYTDLDK